MGYVNSGSFFTQSLYQIFAAEVRRNMIIYVDDVCGQTGHICNVRAPYSAG